MTEENVKLEKVNKSSKFVMIVTRIVCIIMICATVLTFIAAVYMFVSHDKFDGSIPDVVRARIDSNVILSEPVTSDVPALQAYFDENADSYGIKISILVAGASLISAIVAVALSLISGAFAVIVKEGNPFTDKAIKKMLIALIFISAALFFTNGMGTGVIAGLITWAVYTIMDYGRILKVQSDETL